jgi:AcrR family transcriptional regulator
MARAHSGSGDPTNSLVLLWRPRGTAPSPAGLGTDQIVQAAIELADEHGLGAVSMRRVADQLGVGTMSLYTYVPGKSELLDAMLDVVVAEAVPADDVPGGWRERLAFIARENLALLRRHPWILEIDTGRPPLGPNVLAKYEHELRAIEGIGLTDVEMDAVVTLVLSHAAGAARATADARRAEEHTGITCGQWWSETEPVLQRYLEPGDYPLASRVGGSVVAAGDRENAPDHAFDFGLERLLDGVEALLRERGAVSAS